MIIGILLGISIAINLTSLLLILTSTTGILYENMATGAVIGTAGIVSYSLITLILSLITTFFLSMILKKSLKSLL